MQKRAQWSTRYCTRSSGSYRHSLLRHKVGPCGTLSHTFAEQEYLLRFSLSLESFEEADKKRLVSFTPQGSICVFVNRVGETERHSQDDGGVRPTGHPQLRRVIVAKGTINQTHGVVPQPHVCLLCGLGGEDNKPHTDSE